MVIEAVIEENETNIVKESGKEPAIMVGKSEMVSEEKKGKKAQKEKGRSKN